MKKTFQQVWVMSHSELHKMSVLLIQQTDYNENNSFWGPFEWDTANLVIQPEELLPLLQEKYGIQLIEPVIIPLKKTYKREIPDLKTQELFQVVGMILHRQDQLISETSRNETIIMKWVPFRDVLDYLHKEYHSIIFFDWYKAIKFGKLP